MAHLTSLDMMRRAPVAKKWIQSAVKPAHRGLFKEKAEKAGMSTRAFAKKEEDAPGKLGKEARLAETLMGMKKSRRETLYDKKR